MGVPTGITITLVTLWTLNLSNHWADVLQITFNGTILACRCAMSWSFADCSHIGMLTDVILNLEMLQTLQLSNHWSDSFQIKFIGTVLVCRYAALWSHAHRGHIGKPKGMISILVTLWMCEISNHWADSLQIKFIWTVLACRCTASRSFAHWGYMGMAMGVIWVPKILQMSELCNHWQIHSKSSSFEPSWHVDVQYQSHLPIGVTWASPQA